MKSREEIITAWAEIVIRIWEDKMRKLNIVETNALATSFAHHVYSSYSGNVEMVMFTFLYYGRFVDMGVGRGVTLETRFTFDHKRQPKPWYSQTFFRELNKLVRLLAENFGEQAGFIIKEGNRGDITMKM